MKKLHYLLGFATVCSLAACKPVITPDAPSAGNLDFTRYLAVGNSLTAGYADGTLYRSGQQNSYPSMLSKQFEMVGGSIEFRQPLLNSEWGSFNSPRRVLGSSTNCTGSASLSPVVYPGIADTSGDAASLASQGPFNNIGVPGIRTIDYLIPGYALVNPYARRFFASPLTRPLDEVRRMSPTFFTLWIGNNDVLAYATSGGSGGLNGNGFDPYAISSMSIFEAAFDSVLNILTRNGAKGAVINIPDVTAIPFFTTIPAKGLTLDAAKAAALNAAYAGTGMTFAEGPNYFVVEDASVPVIGRRQLRAGEYLLLTTPQDSILCKGWGSSVPIPKRFVLDETEVSNVRSATIAFNQFMMDRAMERGLAYVDINAYLKTLSTGILFNGVTYGPTFVTGGVFSLDGVHLTPRGYALAANEMIRTINSHYGSSVPSIDVNTYGGLRFP